MIQSFLVASNGNLVEYRKGYGDTKFRRYVVDIMKKRWKILLKEGEKDRWLCENIFKSIEMPHVQSKHRCPK